MPKGYVYMLECSNGTIYTGSTIHLNERVEDHFKGQGANHTKRYPPTKLIYVKEFDRIDKAFYREKQIQRWGKDKKLALASRNFEKLKELAECMNDSHWKSYVKE
ncbi:MAG: GIY-YIG nuclease family protein [Crocinitomicaceae bacterium]